MMCVLDSNIGVKWLLQEDQSDQARVVRDEYARGLQSFWLRTCSRSNALTRSREHRGRRE
jgi:predicted nucleic acid-binding protein